MGLSAILTEWVFAVKTLLLLLLIGLLTYVHLGIQSKIESLLTQVKVETIPEEIASKIRSLRLKRKRLAAFCLFIVLTAVILGLQVLVSFNPLLTFFFFFLIALFSWRAYRAPIPFGWA